LTYISYYIFMFFEKDMILKSVIFNKIYYTCITLACSIVSLSLIYFLFIYQIPANIFLSLNSWETISFYYTSRSIMPLKDRYVMIPFRTSKVFAAIHGDKLILNWQFVGKDHSKKSIKKETKIKIAYFNKKSNKDKNIFDGLISEGNIEFFGKDLKIFIKGASKKEDNFHFSALINDRRRIWFTKDIKNLPLSKRLESLENSNSKKINNIIGVTSNDEGIKGSIDRVQGVIILFVPNWMFDINADRDKKESLEVKLPNYPKKFLIEDRENVAIVIGGGDDDLKLFCVDNYLNHLEFYNGENRFETFSLSSEKTQIGDIIVDFPQGIFNINENKIQIGNIDYLKIGGDKLQIRDNKQGNINLIGSSNYILINGIPYSLSLWSSISTEIKGPIIGGIIGAMLTILVTLIIKKFTLFKLK